MTLIFVILACILFLFWANFFYEKKCDSLSCFNANLAECKSAVYTNTEDNITFEYKVLGKNSGKCDVNVRFISGELYEEDVANLIDKEMICSLPLNTLIKPEANIDNCHGILKEELQKLIISKMHTYIVQNLGKINTEIFSAV